VKFYAYKKAFLFMTESTLFIGQILHEFDTLNSTNTYAAELIAESTVKEGTVIVAHAQPEGRGQRGAGWESEANQNITTSIVLRPSFLAIDQQFNLNMAISLGVTDYLKSILKNESIKIKWPNDIYINDKKIAGILIENTLKGSLIGYSIIGIGLNVNQTEFISDAPNPVSLKMITGSYFTIKDSLLQLYKFIEVRYLQLRTNNTEKLKIDYLERLYRFEEWHNYIVNEKLMTARITGINEQGRLQTEDSLGNSNLWDLKEIKFVI
jgi:BirA family biotin operon repressor/biotin-[acetyl-CoA-carboxylase] ligase